jgi:hypothetical protein
VTKRKGGRPKGSRTLPPESEYFGDLLDLFLPVKGRRRSLLAKCKFICSQGGVRWRDRRTGNVTTITDANTLRNRIMDARRWDVAAWERTKKPIKPTLSFSTGSFTAPVFETPEIFLPPVMSSDTTRTTRFTRVGRKLHK